MSSALFEIVELPDGCLALRRAGEEGEPLVSIKFSREAELFLNDSRFEVVKAMIEAGMEAAGDLAAGAALDEEIESEPRIIH